MFLQEVNLLCILKFGLISIFFACSPTTFDVDTTQLNEKYKELQWKLHPDKFSDVSEVLCIDHLSLDKTLYLF